MDIYFILWFINQYYIIDFVDQIVSVSATRNSLLLSPLSLWYIFIPFFFFPNMSLHSSATIAPESFYILPVQALESAISPCTVGSSGQYIFNN